MIFICPRREGSSLSILELDDDREEEDEEAVDADDEEEEEEEKRFEGKKENIDDNEVGTDTVFSSLAITAETAFLRLLTCK